MSEHEHDELSAFLAATRRELDAAIEASPPLPDLDAMFERVRELDPDCLDEESVARQRELAPVLPLRSHELASESQSRGRVDELGSFTAALREQLDAGVQEQRAREIPPPRFAVAQRRPSKRRSWWVTAAASLLLFFGGAAAAMWGEPSSGTGLADSVERGLAAMARELGTVLASGAATRTVALAPSSEPAVEPALTTPADLGSEVVTRDEQSDAVMPTVIDDIEPKPSKPRARARNKPISDEGETDPLALLDAQAQALWRAGDLDGAEELFHEIVRRGGKGRWAELAYGELFSLAQRRSGEVRAKLWGEYLDRFPRGRYAEDARVGLCRRASGEEKASCWTEYLEQHEQGTHVGEARKALGQTKDEVEAGSSP